MPTFMIVLTSVSLVGLLVISIYRFIRFKAIRRFMIQLLVIGTCVFGLYFFFWSHRVTEKGANDIYFVIVLYLFMLFGMFAQYLYTHFAQPRGERNRLEFDFGLFIAPVFASPIVFIPLLAALQNAQIDLRDLDATRLMVFFVAFENGFFWKDYFDHRRKNVGGDGNDA